MKINKEYLVIILFFSLVNFSCASQDWWNPLIAYTPASVYNDTTVNVPDGFKHKPPTSKQILKWLFENGDQTFPKNISCVGTDFDDVTIGDYFNGFLAHMNNKSADNWIEINRDIRVDSNKNRYWLCSIMIHIINEKEEVYFSSGVSFLVEDKKLLVISDSFRCPGAG